MTPLKISLSFFLLISLSNWGWGQTFPVLYNSETDHQATLMPAADAAVGFEVPEGFHVNVFASEPDVQNPIAVSWDSRGRMWVAENFTYAERSQRFDLSLRDRVLILEDTNGDGKADKRTVFTDEVQMLTSVETGHGGVWLMCPPQLLFIPDANGDDVPDGPAEVVLDGFEVAEQNYHNFANGLKWGPDGWLYGRCGGSCPGRVGKPGTPDDQRVALEGGIWRYHPQTQHFEVLTHGTTNPWGHDWDEFGEAFFINTVNGHLWHLIPGAHLHRPFTLDPNPSVYELIDMHADHWHFDTKGDWMKSRDGAANSFGGGHAHSGMMIYQGDHWPEDYQGRLLTLNFHGKRVNQELLSREGSGYIGKHGPDMLAAADPFFRGIEISQGPGGSVYLVDWSDTGECHEQTGVHRTSGRIYRVSHASGGSQKQTLMDLRSMSDRQLADMMTHPNVWFVRQARIILAQRQAGTDSTALPVLLKLAKGANAVEAYRALVTRYAMGNADDSWLREFLVHDNEHLRTWAIRLLTDHWPIDDVFGPLVITEEQKQRVGTQCDPLMETFTQMASRDPSGLVRLALGSTLQRLPVNRRIELATALMSKTEDASDHNLPLLVWHGLMPVAETDPTGLAKLGTVSQWPITQRLIARRLAERLDDHSLAIEMLIDTAIDSKAEVRGNILHGISDGLKGWSQATPPTNWAALVTKTESSNDPSAISVVRDLSVLFGDGRALDEVRKIVLDKEADIGIRRSALETFVVSKDPGVVETCLSLLSEPRLNAIACKGISQSNDPRTAKRLIDDYRHFRGPDRPGVIEVLVSRPVFAKELLNAVQANQIPVADLSAFDVRQIRSMNDPEINQQVSKLWGEVRESPEEKLEQIAAMKSKLTPASLAHASPSRGRVLFNKTCGQCHRLFGFGESVGPDLTGANRSNLDYLLENIVDPSAVVSKDFNMTILLLEDGRILNGLVTSKNEKTLTIQTQSERITIEQDEIEESKTTSKSPMPDGLLDTLSERQVCDLMSYLMQPTQVPLP